VSPGADQQICPGQAVAFTASGGPGATYTWTYNAVPIPGATSATLSASQPGAYAVIASTPACPAVRSPQINVALLAAALKLPPDTTVCTDPPFGILVSINPDFSDFGWSTGEVTRSISLAYPGVYWAWGENQCGRYSDTMRVRTLAEYLPAWPDDTTVCNASGISVLRVPAILREIRWSTGETGASITARRAGLYTVEGQSPCGPIRDTIDVRFCLPVIRDLGISADTICVGDCIRPVAAVENYPVYYYWSAAGATPDTGWSSHPGPFCFDRPGRHVISLRVTNPGGADSAFAEVFVAEKPRPNFRDTALVAPYRSRFVLPACADAAHADWYRNDSLICRDCPELALDATYYFNRYKCIVRNAACPDSCSYSLRVIDIPHQIWLPDAFTPNGDGRNDVFGIITDNPNVQVISFDIYNRWGQRVFAGHLNNGGWDGSFSGKPAEMGSYFWQLRYRILDKPDLSHFMKGDLTLIR
jgi:gliding motility-associated-like protein